MSINNEEKKILLEEARESISARLEKRAPRFREAGSPLFLQKRGLFVTLHDGEGSLRGCIGHIQGYTPLRESVRELALSSAFRDPRFPPVESDELPGLEIEISVLSPLKEVPSPMDFMPGRDGVMIEKGTASAVFLPQVAVEQGWDREQTLDRLCLKAGLPPGAWRYEKMKFFIFQAGVFSEKEFPVSS